MPEKKNIYRIDEQMLRNTLLGYSADFNASHCDAIEQEVASIKMQKTITLPDTRIMMRFVLLPLILLGSGVLIYVNADTIQGWFASPLPAQAETEVQSAPPPAVKQEPVINNTPPPVNTTTIEKDSVIAEPVKNTVQVATKNTASPETTAKKASPVVALPPTDSVAKAETKKEEVKVRDAHTDSVSSTPAPVKKKRKRRHHPNAMDELKESTLQSSSADEDVVVPQ
jgi:hypothetical protein